MAHGANVTSFFLGVFPKTLPMILEKNTSTSKHILKAKPFSSMVLKIFLFGHPENSADMWSTGYSQRPSGRSTALAGPQPTAIAPVRCVVLTQGPEKRDSLHLYLFVFKSKKEKGVKGTRN